MNMNTLQGSSSSSSSSSASASASASSSRMQRHCHCPLSALQWISLCLNQDTLPFDSILQLGSELAAHIKTVLECPRCPATRRMTQMLSQTTSRLVCFYEAVFLNAAAATNPTGASARRGADDPQIIAAVPPIRHPHAHPHPNSLGPYPPHQHHQHHQPHQPHQHNNHNHNHRISPPPDSPSAGTDPSAAPECRSVFCEMKLGKLPLQGAEARMLIEVVLVEACLDLNERIQEWKLVVDELDEQPEDQSDAISRCLDRLAKLIGLLQFDGLPLHCS